MIERVYTGYNPGGLIKYLFGSGRYNEHENPRVIASWDGRPENWQPEWTGPGEFDFDLGALISALQLPAKLAGLPVSNPDPDDPRHRRYFREMPDGSRKLREGYVWNLVLRNDDADRILSDAEWRRIVEEVMHESGVSRRGDPHGCRYVGVRHDDTGVHVAVVLADPVSGCRVRPEFYKRMLRRIVDQVERRFGLTLSAPADLTAALNPSRAEVEKAARQGKVPAREELRAAVAQAAASTTGVNGFARALRDAGYRVEILYLPSGDLRGYKVARRGDVNKQGQPIWFSGSKLAPDLSLPRLVRRWEQAQRGRGSVDGQAGPVAEVHGEIGRLQRRLRPEADAQDQGWRPRRGEMSPKRALVILKQARRTLIDDPDRVDEIAHAVGELCAVIDRGEGRLVHGPGARFDRAARAPYRPVPTTTSIVADELRWLARDLALSRGSAGLQLVAAVAALVFQVAALLQERNREHQARAARQAAVWLTQPPASRPAPRPTQPVASSRPGGRSTSERRSSGRAPSASASTTPPSPPGSGSGSRRVRGSPNPRGPGRGPRRAR